MGNIFGTTIAPTDLSRPITQNRIRTTCQRGSPLPPELRKFELDLLVRDLNILGANIQTHDPKSGKPRNNDTLCEEIQKRTKIDPSEVCMLKTGTKVEPKRVATMVKSINDNFGANILFFVNGDPKLGMRPVADICDDAYMVADTITRNLRDDHESVKEQLYKQIEDLRMEKKLLEASFRNATEGISEAFDIENRLAQFQGLKTYSTSANQVLDNKINFFTKQIKGIDDVTVEIVHPELKKLENQLGGWRKNRKLLKHLSDLESIDHLVALTSRLGPAMHLTKQCLIKLGKEEDNIKKTLQDVLDYDDNAGAKGRINDLLEEIMKKIQNSDKQEDVKFYNTCHDIFSTSRPELRKEIASTVLSHMEDKSGKNVHIMSDLIRVLFDIK